MAPCPRSKASIPARLAAVFGDEIGLYADTRDEDLDRVTMAVFVGRLRPCPVLDYKFMVLGHNTIRGAAGAAILNAELMYSEGLLD